MTTIFWERFTQLCQKNNTSPSAVVKTLGLSTGSPPAWKKGAIPTEKAREKIEDFFNVNRGYLIGVDTQPQPVAEPVPPEPSQPDPDAELMFALFGGEEEVTPEMFAEVKEFAQYVKLRKKFGSFGGSR